MYRYVDIDLTRGADDICTSYSIGNDGEHKATALRVKLPDKFVNSSIVFEFKVADGSSFSSKMIPFNSEIVFVLENFLMVEGLMAIGVVAIDMTTNAVVKPFQKTFVVSDSINVLPTQGFPYGLAADHETRITESEGDISKLKRDISDLGETFDFFDEESTLIYSELHSDLEQKEEKLVTLEKSSHSHLNYNALNEFIYTNGLLTFKGNGIAFKSNIPSQLSSAEIQNILNGSTVSFQKYLGNEHLAYFCKILSQQIEEKFTKSATFNQDWIDYTVEYFSGEIKVYVSEEFLSSVKYFSVKDVIIHTSSGRKYSIEDYSSYDNVVRIDEVFDEYSLGHLLTISNVENSSEVTKEISSFNVVGITVLFY